MFFIVNEVFDWNVEFVVKIGKMFMEEILKCVRVYFIYSIEFVEFCVKN